MVVLLLFGGALAHAQDFSPEETTRLREAAEAQLALRSGQNEKITTSGGEQIAVPPPEELVFIGINGLPTKEGQPVLAQVLFYEYAQGAQYEVVLDVDTQDTVKMSAIKPANPPLAASEVQRATELVMQSPTWNDLQARHPELQIDFTVTMIADPSSTRYGHRILRILLHVDRKYLSSEPQYVDLTTSEILTQEEITR